MHAVDKVPEAERVDRPCAPQAATAPGTPICAA